MAQNRVILVNFNCGVLLFEPAAYAWHIFYFYICKACSSGLLNPVITIYAAKGIVRITLKIWRNPWRGLVSHFAILALFCSKGTVYDWM